MSLRSWSIALLLLLPGALCATDPPPWTVGVRGLGGFIVPHHPRIRLVQDRHALGGELFMQRWFSGRREWHGHYLRPAWGVSALWMRTGSDRMGAAVRVLPYLELPLRAPGALELNFRVGWGLGLVAHPFDRRTNHKQHLVGSRLNIAAQGALVLRRHFGRSAVDVAIALDHLSNGSMQQPNLGVNVASLSLGWSHRLSDAAPPAAVPDSSWRTAPRRWLDVLVNAGMNEVEPVGSGRRGVVSAVGSAYRRSTARSAFGAGVDVFNKGTASLADSTLRGRAQVACTQVGLHGGYNLLFGRLALIAEVGAYVYSPVQESAPLYTRFGMRHRVGERLLINLTLKSHFFVADHFEVGIGYRFP